MKAREAKQKNLLIGGLLAIVLVMAVGYAAFATKLNITGTASFDNTWCLGFDSTKTSAYQATAGVSGGTVPTGSISFDGNTCATNYKTDASLNANFKQPGDKIVYTLTIANKSTLTAAIKSIKVEDQNVTSNKTITKGNIKYTVEMPETTTLAANATTTMKVTAEFQNDTDINKYTTGETQTLDVEINAQQDDGNGGMDVTPTSFTGSIYRNNTTNASIGSSIVAVSGTKYVITNGNQDAPVGPYESQSECQTALEGFGSPAGYSCQEKTGTFGGVGEYTTDASTLNKTYYLKHDVVDDIITASYVCFVTDTEHCMQGGNSSYYAANKTLLQGQETWFNNHSGSCSFGGSDSYCYGGGFNGVEAYSDVNVRAGVSGGGDCVVSSGGVSTCIVSESGGGSGSGGDVPK